MKIVFRSLPEGDGAVKVSLDGGNTFTDHQINTVRENGIPLADNQDYSKILIKGSANILRNLDILSSVKVDGAAQASSNIEWYAWSLSDNEGVIYTETINPTDQCIVYQKMDSNFLIIDFSNQPGPHYFEFSEEGTLLERVYNYKPAHTNVWKRCPSEDIEAVVGIPCTYEKPVYGLGTVTYRCYVLDQDSNGEQDNLGTLCVYVKSVNNKDTFYFYIPWNNNDKPFAEYTNELIDAFKFSFDNGAHVTSIDKQSDNSLVVSTSNGNPGRFIPYPTNDLTNEEETIIDTETVTEVIKFIQDPPTVTENGTAIADDGKAFKLANVEVPKSELGFKCFYDYAPEHYFGEVPKAAQTLDSGTRNYNILMSNKYLKNLYSSIYPGRTYNGVVGIQNHEFGRNVVNNYYTLDSEYNLFAYSTYVGDTTLTLSFYDSITSQENGWTLVVNLLDGSQA